MARTIKQEDYNLRRNTILDAAQRLVYTKGYEQTSIQDLLTELHISKGAFYHYFTSKQDLLEGLIERIAAQGFQVMQPIAQDERLNATEKLLKLFSFASRWKAARKEYLLSLVKVWYADENAILRLKSQEAVASIINPIIASIIQQGIDEGVFDTSYPEQACSVVYSLLMSMGDSMIVRLARPEPGAETLTYLEVLTASYQEAIERVLGASPGSLPLFDPAILREWFPLSTDHR